MEKGLKINAQVAVNGLGELFGLDAKLFTVEIAAPETKKDTKDIQEIIQKEVTERLLPALLTTFGAVLAESMAAAFQVEPIVTREKVLNIYKEDFDKRNQIRNNKEVPMTREMLIEDLIVAWQRLEKDAKCEITKPSLFKLAKKLDRDASQLSRWIKDFVADFMVDGEPNYTHFLNMVQHKKKIREGKETLSIEDEKWLAEFPTRAADQQAIINSVPPEKRRNL